MKKLLLVVMGIVTGVTLAQGQVWQEWEAINNYYASDPSGMVADSLGNVYIAGDIHYIYKYFINKYDSSGVLLWSSIIDSADSYDVYPHIAFARNGDIFISGSYYFAATHADFLTVKYDNNGVQQWHAQYNSSDNGNDCATSLVLDSHGNVYVTGYTNLNSMTHFTTIKYDSNGTMQWISASTNWAGGFNATEDPAKIIIDQEENIFITGYITGADNADYLTFKYNSQGEQQWMAIYDDPWHSWDIAKAIGIDSLGNIYVTGQSNDSLNHVDILTVKYNTNGEEQWIQRHSSPSNYREMPSDLYINSGGNIYISGKCIFGPMSDQSFITLKYDLNGNQQWVVMYDGIPLVYWTHPYTEHFANAVTGDTGGNIYVTGTSEGISTGYDIATIKYNSNGKELWVMRYNDPSNNWDYGNILCLDPKGNIYVAGVTGSPYLHGIIIKYHQTPVTIYTAPVNPQIQIPLPGGNFRFNTSIKNITQSSQSFQCWSMQITPDEVWQGPMLGPISLTLPGNLTVSRQRTQTVPASALAGMYYYICYVGLYKRPLIFEPHLTHNYLA